MSCLGRYVKGEGGLSSSTGHSNGSYVCCSTVAADASRLITGGRATAAASERTTYYGAP